MGTFYFPNLENVMFSKAFTFQLVFSEIVQTYACKWRGRKLKVTLVLWGNFTWSEMGNKTSCKLRRSVNLHARDFATRIIACNSSA